MSDRGRDRAIQLVAFEASVDFTKRIQLSSADEHEQRDRTNETILIVTHNPMSAVIRPMEVGIVPLSWLLSKYLFHKAHTAVISTRMRTERQRK